MCHTKTPHPTTQVSSSQTTSLPTQIPSPKPPPSRAYLSETPTFPSFLYINIPSPLFHTPIPQQIPIPSPLFHNSIHSPNPNRPTYGKSHLRYRLQKSRCHHLKGNYNLPSSPSHFLPKSLSSNSVPSRPNSQPPNQPSPSKSLPISILNALPGVLSTPQAYLPYI